MRIQCRIKPWGGGVSKLQGLAQWSLALHFVGGKAHNGGIIRIKGLPKVTIECIVKFW
jgi:hypothetical protein